MSTIYLIQANRQAQRTTELEALLILSGAIIPNERSLRGMEQDKDEDDDEGEEDDSNTRRTTTQRSIRGKTTLEDDDSDFDI